MLESRTWQCGIFLMVAVYAQAQTSATGTIFLTETATVPSSTLPAEVQDSQHLLVWSVVDVYREHQESRSAILAANINSTDSFLTNASTLFVGEWSSEFWTLAPDYSRRRIYYSDYLRNYFGVYNLESGDHRRVFEGLSYGIDGIAVDWITGNIYWSDIDIHWIMVAEENLNYFKALIPIVSFSPSKIAVHPLKNLLVWTEVKLYSTELYRSDLDGNNVTLLHDLTDTTRIDEMVFDMPENRLYWTDRASGTYIAEARIRSIDLDSPQQITIHLYRIFDRFAGLTLLGDYLYIISSLTQTIQAVNKLTGRGRVIVRHLSDTDLRDVAIYSSEIQSSSSDVQQAHPCFNHSCDQLCLTGHLGVAQCACANGYLLQEDGRSCGVRVLEDNFILGVDSLHERIYQISLENSTSFSALPIANSGADLSVDYDPYEKMVYWADGGRDTVMRSRLNGSSVEIFLSNINAFSIAIDSSSRNLYLVDAARDSIVVASLDLPNVTSTLHTESVYQVWKIIISPSLQKIFWTDWGQGVSVGLIESINFDGTNREVIANETLLPYALAIDEENSVLYWTEDSLLIWINLNTRERGSYETALFDEVGSSYLSALFVHNGYMYIADLYQPNIFRVPVSTVLSNDENYGNDMESIGPTYFYGLSEIHIFSSSTTPSRTTPCASNRGGCPEICVPNATASDVSCVCQDHSTYVHGNNSCTEVLDPGDRIPPTFGNTCPPSQRLLLNECSDTALFNFTSPVATDNSGHVILKAYFQGEPPFRLSLGHHFFSYRAQDTNGNEASCRFSLFIVSSPRCPENLTLPNNTIEGHRSCKTRFGSTVNLTCTNGSDTVMEYRCGISGEWKRAAGPPSCVFPTTQPPPSFERASSSLSSGAVAGIVLGVLAIFAIALSVVLLKRYGRCSCFKSSASFLHLDRVQFKDDVKNIGSTITGTLRNGDGSNPYTTMT